MESLLVTYKPYAVTNMPYKVLNKSHNKSHLKRSELSIDLKFPQASPTVNIYRMKTIR